MIDEPEQDPFDQFDPAIVGDLTPKPQQPAVLEPVDAATASPAVILARAADTPVTAGG